MTCDECGAKTIADETRGEVVCSSCGLIAQPTLIADDPMLDDDGNLNGYGPAQTLNRGASLATPLTITSKDARGKTITAVSRQRLQRLERLDGRVIRRDERVTRKLYAMTASLCTQLGLSNDLRDRAFYLVKAGYKARVLKGQEFSVLVAAGVYLSCRETQRFVELKNLVALAGISRRRAQQQAMHGFLELKRALKVKVDQKSALAMLPAVASQLGLTQEEQRGAAAILQVHEASTAFTGPEADLAAAIYVATKQRLAQKSVVTACGTSEVSLRARAVKFQKGSNSTKAM